MSEYADKMDRDAISRRRMVPKTTVQCGRTHDHEKHTWYSDPTKQCPGVTASPLHHMPVEVGPPITNHAVDEDDGQHAYDAEGDGDGGHNPTPPDFARCDNTYQGNRCVRPIGHEEGGQFIMHVDDKGNGWPAHVPAPGGDITEGDGALDDYDRTDHINSLEHQGWKPVVEYDKQGVGFCTTCSAAANDYVQWPCSAEALVKAAIAMHMHVLGYDHDIVPRYTFVPPDKPCTDKSAHGPHDWEDNDHKRHCDGIKAHPNTQIGRR